MQNVLGLIDDTGEENLQELTEHRSLASVPFAARYRLIDFMLSNMVRGGKINNIGILVKNNSRSLMDHMGSGKEWDLDRKRDGFFILPPPYNKIARYKGNLQYLKENKDFLKRSKQDYVVFSTSNIICNIDLDQVFSFHLSKKSDITVICIKNNFNHKSNFTYIRTGNDHKVVDMVNNPENINHNLISLNIYILKKSLLLDIIDFAASRGQTDLIEDGIIANFDELEVNAYTVTGFNYLINSVEDYFKGSLDLLNTKCQKNLFKSNSPVYTKVKDEPPTKYTVKSNVKNILAANGSVVRGEVQNSIIFRNVDIGKNSHIRNSIIMQNVKIGENVTLENVILDKDVSINKNKEIRGDKKYPFVAKKKSII